MLSVTQAPEQLFSHWTNFSIPRRRSVCPGANHAAPFMGVRSPWSELWVDIFGAETQGRARHGTRHGAHFSSHCPASNLIRINFSAALPNASTWDRENREPTKWMGRQKIARTWIACADQFLPTLSVRAGASAAAATAAAEEEAGCGRRPSCSERGASFPVPNPPMSSARMVIVVGLLLHVLSQGRRRLLFICCCFCFVF